MRVLANGLGLEPEAQAALSGPSAAAQGSGAEGSVTSPQRSWACYLVIAVGCTGAGCRAQQAVHPAAWLSAGQHLCNPGQQAYRIGGLEKNASKRTDTKVWA